MPSETSDIKQFLEIARRKDAKCTILIPHSCRLTVVWLSFALFILTLVQFLLTFGLFIYSCADQEKHQDERDQVQDPMQPLPLHT
jgi:hypothetical protein